jgi:hypothetical protein
LKKKNNANNFNNNNNNDYNSNIELKKFNLMKAVSQKDNFHKPNVFCIIGKRGVGKTQLAKEILLVLKNNNIVENVILFANLSNANEYNGILLQDQINKIKNELKSGNIEQILKFQSNNITKPLLLIFDDVIYSKALLQANKAFYELIYNARHYNIYTIFTIQYPLHLPPEIRVNIDFIFVFEDNFISSRKRIYEYYFGIIPQFKLFDKIMSEYCKNYGILVIDNFPNNNLFENKVMYYKCNQILPENNQLLKLLELNYNEKKNKSKFVSSKIENISNTNLNINPLESTDLIKDTNTINNYISTNKNVNDDIYFSDNSDISKSKKMDKNEVIAKIKKNNKIIKKITKQNEKLCELLELL